MTNYFDLISLIAALMCAKALWQLLQNWSEFWDDQVTWKDRELVAQLAVFVLIPIGVLLHEIGHSLATWQVGGIVSTFQWRFYWGYIIASGNFSSFEYWWIAFSGNLITILLGLLPILFVSRVRKRIIGELLYCYACIQSVYALLGYPLISLILRKGDWIKIYDFTVQPYASLTLVIHVGLLCWLWWLYHSQKAIQWRLARNFNALNTWKKLKENITDQPNNLQLRLELAHFLFRHNETHEAKRIAQKIYRTAPNDERVQILRVVDACVSRDYRKAIQLGRKLLNIELLPEDQLVLYRILCFSSYNIRQLPEAISYANQGLNLDPKNYKLRYHRAVVHRMLRQHQEARADLEVALENAPDEDSLQQIQRWAKKV
jgi:tetratricopeptide (TPR) repeat protein